MHPDFYKDYLEIKDYDYQKLLYVSNPNKYLVTLYLLQKHEGDKIIIFSDNLFTIKQYNEFFLKKVCTFAFVIKKIM